MYRPSTVSDKQAKRVHEEIDEFRIELRDYHVEELLVEIPSREIRDIVRGIVFRQSELVPKRINRPKYRLQYVSKQVYLAYDPDSTYLDELLQFSTAWQEYIAMIDDFLDGDLADGTETEVVRTAQFLVPLSIGKLTEIGADAVSYMIEHSIQMFEAPIEEVLMEPSADTYLALIDSQSEMYGYMIGLAALAADADDEAISRANLFGQTFYKLDKFLMDAYQYENEYEETWNACEFMSTAEVLHRIDEWESELVDYLESLPGEQARKLEPLIRIDTDQWIDIDQ